MIKLNVNIDHAATLREARKGREPEPVHIAQMAVLAGADGIVAHLREDRRHVNDRDVMLIRQLVETRFDLEMAATPEIVKIALKLKPDLVTIVPEKRTELTTEGGLNVESNIKYFKSICSDFHKENIEVSFFIEPEINQIEAAHKAGADIVELHTGTYALHFGTPAQDKEFERIQIGAEHAASAGLKIAAGHGLNYFNIKELLEIYEIEEYSIGHSIISRSLFTGIDKAVRDMIAVINRECSY